MKTWVERREEIYVVFESLLETELEKYAIQVLLQSLWFITTVRGEGLIREACFKIAKAISVFPPW